MRTNDRLNAVEHTWCEESDRWIYIERYASGYLGLNFMQGDEYDYFTKKWCHNDQGLTDFYHSMLYTFPIEKASVNTIEFINKCMWAFHTAVVAREDHPYPHGCK